VIYLYGGLLYYAGLLARKAGLAGTTRYVLPLLSAEKVARLFRWIGNYEKFAQHMFEAGLRGPLGRATSVSPTVVVKTL